MATPAHARMFAGEDSLSAVLAPLLIKRLREPADVAALAIYLASDESSYVNFVIGGA